MRPILGAIPNPLDAVAGLFPNPVEMGANWLNEQVRDLAVNLGLEVDRTLLTSPTFGDNTFLENLYYNSMNLSVNLIIGVMMITVVLALFSQKRIRSLPHAFMVMVVMGITGHVFFTFCDWLVQGGNDATRAILSLDSTVGSPDWDESGLSAADIVNLVGSGVGMAFIAGSRWVLSWIFHTYPVTIVIAKFAIPIAFAISPVGPRSKKILSWFVSMALVTMLLGRPAAAAWRVAATWAIDATPLGNSAFAATSYLSGAMIGAIITQFGLLYLCYVGTQNVAGRVNAFVRGQIHSLSTKRHKVDVASVQQGHAGALRVTGAPAPAEPSRASRVTQATKQAAVRKGAAAISQRVGTGAVAANVARTAGRSHPMVAVAAEVGRKVYNNRKKKHP